MVETALEDDAWIEGPEFKETRFPSMTFNSWGDCFQSKPLFLLWGSWYLDSLKVQPRQLIPLTASHPVVHSQRVQHALDIFNTAGYFGNKFINTSQSISRMVSGRDGMIPCITPSGAFFSMAQMRYLTGLACKKHVWHPVLVGFFWVELLNYIRFWSSLTLALLRHREIAMPGLSSPCIETCTSHQCSFLTKVSHCSLSPFPNPHWDKIW